MKKKVLVALAYDAGWCIKLVERQRKSNMRKRHMKMHGITENNGKNA